MSPPRRQLPAQFRRVRADGPGPFVTREVYRAPDGREIVWESRAHRKADALAAPPRGSIWWQPQRRSWWLALLFSIGSLCFAAGGIGTQWSIAGARALDLLFFVGSLFFTAAAYLQYLEAVNADRGVDHALRRVRLRPASWEPRRIDWLATAVQLGGTLLFNLSTGFALEAHLDIRQTDLRVWAPDLVGSIAFLVSSQLAYAENCHRWFCVRRRRLPWWVLAANLLGSLAFGASAVGSLVLGPSGLEVSSRTANAGTWIGGLLFLLGSVLLVPEAVGHSARRRRDLETLSRGGPSRPPTARA